MPSVAKSIWVPQAVALIPIPRDEKIDAAGGTPHSVTPATAGDSSGFTNIDVSQEILGE